MVIKERPPKIDNPVRTAPSPTVAPIRRYQPDPDHCPSQRIRTTRRIRRVVEPD